MAAAMVTDGQVARIAAAAGALLDCQQRLVRPFVVMSSFTSEVWKRSVGVIGLYVLIGIVSLVLLVASNISYNALT